jgi:hypothetical protein
MIKRASLYCAGIIALITISLTGSASGQISNRNPLDELRDQVVEMLAEAGCPFTPEQEKQLALLIEEQRLASEDLFGEIMDFRNGVPQGQERDRALAGIQWIHNEFRKRLPNYLSDEQRLAWEKWEGGEQTAETVESAANGKTGTQLIQQIRINNNPFSSEDGGESNFGNIIGVSFGGNFGNGGGGGNFQNFQNGGGNFQNNNNRGGNPQNNNRGGGNRASNERTQIIERGGTGAWHGNFSANFQDDKLNARNPFAQNKPPYHERTINGNFDGPLIQDRLTAGFGFSNNRQENVGTVKAQLPEGPFSLGVTRPNVSQIYNGRAILQFSATQSIHFSGRHGTGSRKNQGVGDFSLPSRGIHFKGTSDTVDIQQISVLSRRTVYETRLQLNRNHNTLKPVFETVGINVLDAFRGGGAQEHNDQRNRTIEFGNLLYRTGEKSILRLGFDGRYREQHNRTEANFNGEFTFSDLESYRNGLPLKYRVTRGNPIVGVTQLDMAYFIQNDYRLTNRFTFFYGGRYERQTNIRDKNNFDPRLAAAYAVGGSTVLRGGFGVFHQRVQDGVIQNLLRLDGTHQYEILIDNPGWPDAFASGLLKVTPPSRRVRDANLVAPYNVSSSFSFERTLPANLFIAISTDYNRGVRLLRSRDLNAPFSTGLKLFPDEGHIYQLESTGKSVYKTLRFSMRQRFSVFNITGSYTLASGSNEVDQPFDLPANNYDLKSEWGRANSVQKHSFNTSVNARMPFDVYLTTIVSANSGRPYDITTGQDENLDGQTNDRPSGLMRNSAWGPRFFNVSFNFSKAFRLGGGSAQSGQKRGTDIGGGAQLSVFLNANNALNMTNPGTPSGVMTSPFFGKSFNGSASREIEAGMRFQF